MIKPKFICKQCNKEFMTKQNMKKHFETSKCKQLFELFIYKTEIEIRIIDLEKENLYFKEETKLQKERIKELEKEVLIYKALSEKPHTINNNNKYNNKYNNNITDKQHIINNNKYNNTTDNSNHFTKYESLNVFNLTDERIEKIVNEKFTITHYNEGQIGVAKFTHMYLLIDETNHCFYICSNKRNNDFVYKGIDGKIHEDLKGKQLTSKIAKVIIRKSQNIHNEKIDDKSLDLTQYQYYNEKFMDIRNLECNNSGFANQLTIKVRNNDFSINPLLQYRFTGIIDTTK